MIVSELIELLRTMPQDALVIRTLYSDYDTLEPDQVTLMEPSGDKGLIFHHGHLMQLLKGWRDRQWPAACGEKVPADVKFVTAVHFAGN